MMIHDVEWMIVVVVESVMEVVEVVVVVARVASRRMMMPAFGGDVEVVVEVEVFGCGGD